MQTDRKQQPALILLFFLRPINPIRWFLQRQIHARPTHPIEPHPHPGNAPAPAAPCCCCAGPRVTGGTKAWAIETRRHTQPSKNNDEEAPPRLRSGATPRAAAAAAAVERPGIFMGTLSRARLVVWLCVDGLVWSVPRASRKKRMQVKRRSRQFRPLCDDGDDRPTDRLESAHTRPTPWRIDPGSS